MNQFASARKDHVLQGVRNSRRLNKFSSGDSYGRPSSFSHKLSQIFTGSSGGGTHILGGVKELDEDLEASYGDEKLIEGSDAEESLSPLNRNLSVSAAPGMFQPQAGAKQGEGERPSSVSHQL